MKQKFKSGDVLEYLHNDISAYRVEVVAQVGPVIFAHAVFTDGRVQRVGSLQTLDVRDLKALRKVKAGEAWVSVRPKAIVSSPAER